MCLYNGCSALSYITPIYLNFQLLMFIKYSEQKEIWHETYRFRVLVEGIFSALKRKHLNYLRSKKEIALHVELLLKVLVYNLTIIGKYS